MTRTLEEVTTLLYIMYFGLYHGDYIEMEKMLGIPKNSQVMIFMTLWVYNFFI
jgi:hypothetical protein